MGERGTPRRKLLLYALGLVLVTAAIGGAWTATDWLRGYAGGADGSPASSDDTVVADRSAAADSVTRFRALADSLEGSLDDYGALTGSPAAGTPDCESLARRYRAVDEAFVTLAVHLRGLDDGDVSSRMEDRFQSLLGRVEDVNADFDASGCPRPN